VVFGIFFRGHKQITQFVNREMGWLWFTYRVKGDWMGKNERDDDGDDYI